jgi:hypothetical protein
MHGREDRRMAALSLLLFAGPVMILLACFLVGPWDLTGSERRASLQFAGIMSMALLVPLPSPSWSLFDLRTRVRRWGRIVGAGLVVAS